MGSYPTTPSFRLDGKRALVTGASRGIGLGGAIALAEAGAHVVLAARSAADLDAAVEHLIGKGCSAEACVMDVTDIDATQGKIAELGPFDILFNNAGIARHTAMTETTVSDFDDVIEINLKAVYFASQAVLRGMIGAGIKGSIIHTSSQMGTVGGIDRAVYCTTKFGVEGLTKAMAIEAGKHGIRVNTLAPTFIRTPLAEQSLAIPERRTWVESMIKLGRVGEIEDIMGPVVFLASDASALMTGATLLIDGGWTAD